MEFTVSFLNILVSDLLYASPILLSLMLIISLFGVVIGRIEGWPLSASLYHAFINATTVGYGDLHPTAKRARLLAVILAFVGLLFTGMVVAISLHAADHAYAKVYDTVRFSERGRSQATQPTPELPERAHHEPVPTDK